jgi:hypothetical protein
VFNGASQVFAVVCYVMALTLGVMMMLMTMMMRIIMMMMMMMMMTMTKIVYTRPSQVFAVVCYVMALTPRKYSLTLTGSGYCLIMVGITLVSPCEDGCIRLESFESVHFWENRLMRVLQ